MPSLKCADWARKCIYDTDSRVIAVSAGLGSGKTHGAAQWHLARCFQNNKSPFSAVYQPIFRKLKDTTLPAFKKVLGELGFKQGKDYIVHVGQEPKIKLLATNQEIHLVTANNPEMIVGVEHSHATIDEAGDTHPDAFNNIRARIRCPRATCRQLLVVGAPQGINWFSENFDSDTLEGWEKYTEKDAYFPKKAYRRLRLHTSENPFLPVEYIENLYDTYGHSENLIKSYVEGIFCPLTEGAAYSNFRPRHVIENRTPTPHSDLILCFDFNAMPLAWVSIQMFPFDETTQRILKYVCLHEAQEGYSLIDEACIEFAVKHPVSQFGNTPILVYGDRSGHAKSHKISGSDYDTILKTLQKLGYRNVSINATRTVAPEAESVEAVQRLLYNDYLLICDRLKNLKNSLLATTWKENVRKLDKPTNDTWTHFTDAVKYWAWQETRHFSGKAQRQVYGLNR